MVTSPVITCIHDKYANSNLPKRYEIKFLTSHHFQSWMYVYTFLSFYELLYYFPQATKP